VRRRDARPDRRASRIAEYLPAVGRLRSYRRQWLRGDLAAGVTTAAVVIPQAMAYATIAGLPVQTGLYVATVPMLVYALLGTSRPLSVSTTSTLAALTAAAVAVAAHGDPSRAPAAAATLAALSGGLLLGAGLLRLGVMADFISAPVLAGFKAGTGLLIAAGQLGKVLGVPQEGDSFPAKVGSALSHLGQVSWPTVGLAAGSIVILLGLRRWGPRSLPGPLIVVALGVLLAVATGLADRGVALVGEIPPGLPRVEAPDLAMVTVLLPAAAGVALMAFVESIAAARAFTAGDEPEVDADQELRALGAANLAGGCFQAFPAGGGLSQTAVNRDTGARSQVAGGRDRRGGDAHPAVPDPPVREPPPGDPRGGGHRGRGRPGRPGGVAPHPRAPRPRLRPRPGRAGRGASARRAPGRAARGGRLHAHSHPRRQPPAHRGARAPPGQRPLAGPGPPSRRPDRPRAAGAAARCLALLRQRAPGSGAACSTWSRPATRHRGC
jgi:hypothetical protein